MRAPAEHETSQRPQPDSASTNPEPMAWQIERFLGAMSGAVSLNFCLWETPLRILLTHPQPPEELREFHRQICSAVLHAEYDEAFVEHLVAALAAVDQSQSLCDFLGPTRSALTCFIGTFSRRPSVLMDMVARLVGGTDIDEPIHLAFATPPWNYRSLPMKKADAMSGIRACVRKAIRLLLQERSEGTASFSTWSETERLAGLEALWLAYTYCEVGTSNHGTLDAKELQEDLSRFGWPLWKQLDSIIRESASAADHPQRKDLDVALGRLSLSVETASPTPSSGIGLSTEKARRERSTEPATHVVCSSPILSSTEKHDAQEIERHRVLETPLPVAGMPAVLSLEGAHARLVAEFPWASAAIIAVFDDLLGRANLGVRHLTLPATLLVGQPGAGKSRLARRIAEELGLPRLDVSLSGNSDTKLLGGTSRGWAGGRPSDMASLMVREQCASAIVMLDEIDKARDHHGNGGGITDYLLPLLEPETASRHYDSFLKTECDFSKVSWLCTANTLSGVSKPLQTRLRILLIPQPLREHLPTVCDEVIRGLEREWQMPSGTIPSGIELGVDLSRLTSARQVRIATEVAVSLWARSIIRH